MTNLIRPAARRRSDLSPSWKVRPEWLAVAVRGVLTLLSRTRESQQFRRVVHIALVLLAFVVQGALLLTAAYLCDLALSLMELWADLARKHLELTL